MQAALLTAAAGFFSDAATGRSEAILQIATGRAADEYRPQS